MLVRLLINQNHCIKTKPTFQILILNMIYKDKNLIYLNTM